VKIQNFGYISKMWLERWMAATSTAHHQSISILLTETAKVLYHKTVFLVAHLKFVYAYTGWERSATDAQVYEGALSDGLNIPGKYYLADAGFPSCEALLIPY
jgi:hypothetical protein